MAYKVKYFQRKGKEVMRGHTHARNKYEAERKVEKIRGDIKGFKEQYPKSRVYKTRITIQKE